MTIPDSPAQRAQRLTSWAPLRALTDLAHVVADTWRLTGENHTALQRLEKLMADNSDLLNDVAAKLNDRVFPAVRDLIASEKAANERATAAEARAAQLEGANAEFVAEDVRESAAAEKARAATDEVSGLFAAAPDAPDVAPLPVEPTL